MPPVARHPYLSFEPAETNERPSGEAELFPQRKSLPQGRLFRFLYYKFRISYPGNKHAKYL